MFEGDYLREALTYFQELYVDLQGEKYLDEMQIDDDSLVENPSVAESVDASEVRNILD